LYQTTIIHLKFCFNLLKGFIGDDTKYHMQTGVRVLSITFNNNSVISWRCWWGKTEKTTDLWLVMDKLLKEYTLPWEGFEITTLVVIGTDCIGSCNLNTIRWRPWRPQILTGYMDFTSVRTKHVLSQIKTNIIHLQFIQIIIYNKQRALIQD